jgi:hypothetical protein
MASSLAPAGGVGRTPVADLGGDDVTTLPYRPLLRHQPLLDGNGSSL